MVFEGNYTRATGAPAVSGATGRNYACMRTFYAGGHDGFFSLIECVCVCGACHCRYDDLALHCLLIVCLQVQHNNVVYLLRSFVTTIIVSISRIEESVRGHWLYRMSTGRKNGPMWRTRTCYTLNNINSTYNSYLVVVSSAWALNTCDIAHLPGNRTEVAYGSTTVGFEYLLWVICAHTLRPFSGLVTHAYLKSRYDIPGVRVSVVASLFCEINFFITHPNQLLLCLVGGSGHVRQIDLVHRFPLFPGISSRRRNVLSDQRRGSCWALSGGKNNYITRYIQGSPPRGA